MIPVVGRITGDLSRLDVAEVAAKTVLASPSAVPVLVSYASGGLALIATLRKDSVMAAELYVQLEDNQNLFSPGFMWTWERVRALLAQTMEQLDLAMVHFDKALSDCTKAGYRPEMAWTKADIADCLLQRNGDGDRAKAISLMEDSLAMASEMGMRPLMERVLARREILSA